MVTPCAESHCIRNILSSSLHPNPVQNPSPKFVEMPEAFGSCALIAMNISCSKKIMVCAFDSNTLYFGCELLPTLDPFWIASKVEGLLLAFSWAKLGAYSKFWHRVKSLFHVTIVTPRFYPTSYPLTYSS